MARSLKVDTVWILTWMILHDNWERDLKGQVFTSESAAEDQANTLRTIHGRNISFINIESCSVNGGCFDALERYPVG